MFDDPTANTFDSSCEYKTETITCKEFIERQYNLFEEYYDYNGGVPIKFFYAVVNKVLQNKLYISFDNLFFNSIDSMRLNTYKFSMPIEANSVIRYELPVSIQRNYAFKPLIYMAEQKQVGNYATSYTIELSNDIPYIIESSNKTENKGLIFTAETAEDFYFVFSSSEKPNEDISNLVISNKNIDVAETAFGIALANATGFEINKDYINNTLNDIYSNYVVKSSDPYDMAYYLYYYLYAFEINNDYSPFINNIP